MRRVGGRLRGANTADVGHPRPGARAVKPETALFMSKARTCLTDAKSMAAVPPADAAGRTAYLAAFHAAQALLFERESRVVKTHSGVHTEWQRLTRGDADVDQDLRKFLSRSYRFKVTADYGLDPLDRVTEDQASTAIEVTERFIALLEAKLATPSP